MLIQEVRNLVSTEDTSNSVIRTRFCRAKLHDRGDPRVLLD